MEYFEFGDLGQCVTAPLPEVESQRILFQVAEALEFMHEKHFTHRDLKPSVRTLATTNEDFAKHSPEYFRRPSRPRELVGQSRRFRGLKTGPGQSKHFPSYELNWRFYGP